MIEVVSPARTLRFKGETTVEHRLWSDSLHRLCNPPKPAPPKQEVALPVADHKARDEKSSEPTSADTRAASNEAAAAQRRASEAREREQARLAATARAEREKLKVQAERVDSSRRKRSDSFDCRRRHSSRSNSASDRSDGSDDDHSPRPGRRNSLDKAPSSREPDRPSSREQQRNLSSASRGIDREQYTTRQASREPTPHREDDDYDRNDRRSPPRSQRQYSSDHDRSSSDDDSDLEHERETKLISDPCRPSLLVAQIKATSARNMSAAEPKSSRMETAAKRDPVATKAPVEAKDDDEEQQRPASLSIALGRAPAAQRAKSSVQHDDDSEDDDPEQETPRDESAHEPMDSPPKTAQTEKPSNHSSTAAEEARPKPPKQTEYFDSDEEDEEQDNHRRSQPSTAASKSEPVKASAAASAGTIDGIARDNNFVEEDWDADDEPLPTTKMALPMTKSPEEVCSLRSFHFSTEY